MDIQRAIQEIELQAAEESHYGDCLGHNAPQELGDDHEQQRGENDE